MKLPEKAVRKFQEIYKREFGEEVTYGEAEEMGQNLVRFFEVLMRIDRRENKDESHK